MLDSRKIEKLLDAINPKKNSQTENNFVSHGYLAKLKHFILERKLELILIFAFLGFFMIGFYLLRSNKFTMCTYTSIIFVFVSALGLLVVFLGLPLYNILNLFTSFFEKYCFSTYLNNISKRLSFYRDVETICNGCTLEELILLRSLLVWEAAERRAKLDFLTKMLGIGVRCWKFLFFIFFVMLYFEAIDWKMLFESCIQINKASVQVLYEVFNKELMEFIKFLLIVATIYIPIVLLLYNAISRSFHDIESYINSIKILERKRSNALKG